MGADIDPRPIAFSSENQYIQGNASAVFIYPYFTI